jgi:LysM repeat protein
MSTVTINARIKAPASTATGTRPAPLRLTRRGRLVVTVLLLGLTLVLFTVFSGYSAATGDAGEQVPSRTVVVGEGDTLWEIASEVAEPGETREVVHQIQQLNSLPGPELVEGQELAVPVG